MLGSISESFQYQSSADVVLIIFKKSKTELTLDLKKSSEYGTTREKEKVSLSQMGKRHTQAFIGAKRMNTRTNLYATNLDESGM